MPQRQCGSHHNLTLIRSCMRPSVACADCARSSAHCRRQTFADLCVILLLHSAPQLLPPTAMAAHLSKVDILVGEIEEVLVPCRPHETRRVPVLPPQPVHWLRSKQLQYYNHVSGLTGDLTRICYHHGVVTCFPSDGNKTPAQLTSVR